MFDLAILRNAAADGDRNEQSDLDAVSSAVIPKDSGVEVKDTLALSGSIGVLARLAAFGNPEVRINAHRAAWEIAKSLGIFPASIDGLYRAIGSGAIGGFTVPAMNMRAIAFQSARGVFKAMRDSNIGTAIFELSRGEIGFTGQRPHEYATSILCAAIAEGHVGPVFLQGDHFQISAARYSENPDAEVEAVEALIAEAVSAGFYNIDIDTSTLVDLSQDSVDAQQHPNYSLSARLANFTRRLEPNGVTISIGGEIGEVGDQNSTVEEVDAYLNGFASGVPDGMPGLTKLSVQSGTRHGGNVLADGSFGDMPIDFALIGELSRACRQKPYELAGCVQHGASMLTLEKIARLPDASCVEVHLAAAFLNTVYKNLSAERVREADEWAKQNFANEWKPDWSEAQFLHHARRYPIGPFKKAWWDDETCHADIREAVRGCAAAYFTALRVCETRDAVAATITHTPVDWVPPVSKAGRVEYNESTIKDLAS